jgi:crotonobetainyl-CoA:carnitine CoA-transferase CaiB-like acyl-CoA transferase
VFIVCLDNQWPNLCEAMGRPDLAADPRFASNGARVANRETLNALIDDYLARFKTPFEAAEAMGEARVPVAPILSVAEAMHHPHLIDNHIVRMIDDPVYGSFQVPGMPLHFSDDPGGLALTAEYLGQSNGAVLRDVLGMSEADIAGLERDGVLVSKPDLDQVPAS